MSIKRLPVLLLAVSMVATQSVSSAPVAEKKEEPAKKVVTSKQVPVRRMPVTKVPAKQQMPVKKVPPRQLSAKKQQTGAVRTVKAKPAPAKAKLPARKVAKKSRGKRIVPKKAEKKTDFAVAKLGKFDARGSIKSFNGAANNIIEFMNENGSSATVNQKSELFTVIARFNWITGKKNFDTPAHIAETEKLLNEASKHPALFGPAKMKFINKWKVTPRKLVAKQKEIAKAPIKKVTQKPVVKAVEKRKTAVQKTTAVRY